MKYYASGFAALLITAFGSTGIADDKNEEKAVTRGNSEDQYLIDEPSRSDLFKIIIRNEEMNIPGLSEERTTYFNLYGPFLFPNDAIYDVMEAKNREDSIFGIDISHHTRSDFPIDSLFRKKVKFIYMKASQGIKFKDKKFPTFWSSLDKLPYETRVHRGAYHFLSACNDKSMNGHAQANNFLKVIRDNGGMHAKDMPPVLDLEWDKENLNSIDRWESLNSDQITSCALQWLSEVKQKTGRTPMIYTARSWWKERIGENKISLFKDYKLWIADYSKSSRAIEVPKVPNSQAWHLWQFTDNASMAQGFSYGFDASIFKGTEKQFYETFETEPY